MTTLRKLLVFPLVLLTLAPGAAFADQQHIVNPNQLAAATVERAAAQDADRAVVREVLARDEVRTVAKAMGVDLAQVNDAVATMGAADLEQTASVARQVNDQLVGGASTVVISTTTIIIALLVLILIIIAVK